MEGRRQRGGEGGGGSRGGRGGGQGEKGLRSREGRRKKRGGRSFGPRPRGLHLLAVILRMASVSSAALSSRGARPLLQFLRLVGRLKRVPRTGWVYRNVEKPESVSDHMYRMAVMAMVTQDDHLNKDRCIRLALVHDMAECIVGDIAPADNIPKEEKHRREEEAMKQITQLLPEDLRKELFELWEEYETQASAEAKFVKQLDQCEMILQASEYEDLENKPGRLQDFYDSTADAFPSRTELVVVS
uniref:5'-deoxynucleotidase HDDC2 n=1 Tax=Oryctolagus cuniculus TaxID=9986 RepID=A0A5F9DV57_RABIT